jgi:hypothetical protein
LIVAMLVIIAGVSQAFGMPVTLATPPCPDGHSYLPHGESQHHQQQAPAKQQGHAGACFSCCVGDCVAAPGVARSTAVTVAFATVAVVYPETAVTLAGRSPRPEPAPPRTFALS